MHSIIFIPARKGSTGIKHKNLVKLRGKPLINYTLTMCKKFSKNFFVFISTDSKKIKNYVKKFGFNNEYVRPKRLSTSKSDIVDAIIHGVEWVKLEKKIEVKDVILLQPTSPLRKYKDVIKALKIYKTKKLKSLTSVTKVRDNSLGHIRLEKNKRKWNYLYRNKKIKIINRQEYPNDHYMFNGSFYFCDYNYLKKRRSLVKENETYLFETDRLSSVDIDYKSDLILAELLINKIK